VRQGDIYVAMMRWLSVARSWPEIDPTAAEIARGETEFLSPITAEDGLFAQELTLKQAYDRWPLGWGDTPTPLHVVEEPLLRRLLLDQAPTALLNAGCGTGRHTARMLSAGHTVVGVDSNEAMLARARVELPQATFRVGDLQRLPLDDHSVGGALCSLTIGYEPNVRAPIAELVRVIRPGGRLILTEVHPASVMIGLHVYVPSPDPDVLLWVRKHAHLVEDYLSAFRAHNLVVNDCHELPWSRAALMRSDLPGAGDGKVMLRALLGWPALLAWDVQVGGR